MDWLYSKHLGKFTVSTRHLTILHHYTTAPLITAKINYVGDQGLALLIIHHHSFPTQD